MNREIPILYVPRNEAQRQVVRAYNEHDILFLLGPAGSGKTHAALAPALREIVNHKKQGIRKLILSRPQVEAGEVMGFLPGGPNEKMGPWMLPFYDVLSRMTAAKPEAVFQEHVEVVPLAFMRGRTFDHCAAVLDEAQNCTLKQLRMFLTRLGENAKLLICGDPDQSDLPQGSVLSDVANALHGLYVDGENRRHSVGVVRFAAADIIRHPLIGAVLDKLRTLEECNGRRTQGPRHQDGQDPRRNGRAAAGNARQKRHAG